MVVEVAHCLLDAPLQLRADGVAVVEDVRDGANGDFGSSCDLLNRGIALINIRLPLWRQKGAGRASGTVAGAKEIRRVQKILQGDYGAVLRGASIAVAWKRFLDSDRLEKHRMARD
jgi:hypothetical protein